MEDEARELKNDINAGWQLRWGHIVIGVVVLVLAGAAGVFFHSNNTATNSNCSSIFKGACSSGNHPKKSTPQNAVSPKKTMTSPKTTPSSSTPAPSSSLPATPSNQATTNSTQLANTGPGDVVGLFAGIAMSGAALYNLRIKRHLSNSGEEIL